MSQNKTRAVRRESSLERSFFAYLKKHCPKVQNRKMHGTADPDRLILLPKHFAFFIEFKRDGENPQESQEIRHAQLSELGYTILIVSDKRSADGAAMMVRGYYDKWIKDEQAKTPT